MQSTCHIHCPDRLLPSQRARIYQHHARRSAVRHCSSTPPPAPAQAAAAGHGPVFGTSLEVGHFLAQARAQMMQAPPAASPAAAQLQDPWAQHLSQGRPPLPAATCSAAAVSTLYADELLLRATALVSENSVARGEYRQVVLLGDGLDTRSFRLPWPPGTLLFLVAPPEAHQAARSALAALPPDAPAARVPRGCLLRRVDAQLQAGGNWMDALHKAGFRGDRVSVWALQGLANLQLSSTALTALLTELSSAAAYHSLVFGELPPMARAAADTALAECGLMASLLPFGCPQLDYGWWQQEWSSPEDAVQPWIFTAQHIKLSLTQLGLYEAHVDAAEEADEDFFGNFT